MRRLISKIFLCAGMVLLVGCAKETNQEPSLANETTAVQESLSEETTTQTEATNDNLADDDYRLVSYAVVMGEYRKALESKLDYNALIDADISEINSHMYDGNPLEQVGYAFFDFNNDGVDELLIAPCDQSGDAIVYDMYTLVDGVETHIFSSHERDSYRIVTLTDSGKDYAFSEIGSSGAAYTEWIQSSFDGNRLVVSQAVKYDGNDANPWQMGYEKDGQLTYDQVIDEQLGKDLVEAWANAEVKLEYTPLSK